MTDCPDILRFYMTSGSLHLTTIYTERGGCFKHSITIKVLFIKVSKKR